jgi:hypothetical protein
MGEAASRNKIRLQAKLCWKIFVLQFGEIYPLISEKTFFIKVSMDRLKLIFYIISNRMPI